MTFAGGKEHAVIEKSRITGDSLSQMLIDHNLKDKSGVEILWVIREGIIQEWGMRRKTPLVI